MTPATRIRDIHLWIWPINLKHSSAADASSKRIFMCARKRWFFHSSNNRISYHNGRIVSHRILIPQFMDLTHRTTVSIPPSYLTTIAAFASPSMPVISTRTSASVASWHPRCSSTWKYQESDPANYFVCQESDLPNLVNKESDPTNCVNRESSPANYKLRIWPSELCKSGMWPSELLCK